MELARSWIRAGTARVAESGLCQRLWDYAVKPSQELRFESSKKGNVLRNPQPTIINSNI